MFCLKTQADINHLLGKVSFGVRAPWKKNLCHFLHWSNPTLPDLFFLGLPLPLFSGVVLRQARIPHPGNIRVYKNPNQIQMFANHPGPVLENGSGGWPDTLIPYYGEHPGYTSKGTNPVKIRRLVSGGHFRFYLEKSSNTMDQRTRGPGEINPGPVTSPYLNL